MIKLYLQLLVSVIAAAQELTNLAAELTTIRIQLNIYDSIRTQAPTARVSSLQ
jgi:hypothetical protein